ncbi:MAG: cell division protein FtsX [Helicobacter sp.]|nr:cell division protein FtsX [Helicobacter sp.]
MNSLKNHLSLIIPLIALLFALESILLIHRTLSDYENKLGNNYAIIFAASKEVTLEQIKQKIPDAKNLNTIDSKIVLEYLGGSLSQSNLSLLKNSLPFFYSLTLNAYPNTSHLEEIYKDLKSMDNILRIETFTKSHNQIYQLLLIINGSILVFSSLIALISTLLMFKQIKIWKFEHLERMEIMALLGAPLWMRSQILFRLACLDTIIAVIIIGSGLFYAVQNPYILSFMQDLGINPEIFSPLKDLIILSSVGLMLSLISIWIISIQVKDKNAN